MRNAQKPRKTRSRPTTGGKGGTRDREQAGRRDSLLSALGRRVQGLRVRRGWSQQQLASQAGFSLRFIAQLESGQGNISVARLADIARALETPVSTLLAGSGSGNGLESGEAEALRGDIAAALERLPAGELRDVLDSLRKRQAEDEAFRPAVIALVGLRGAGKSTLGPLLAKALKRPFLEIDEEIQEMTGLATSEIFEMHGEEYYRNAERSVLERLIREGRPMVLAISGGGVTDPGILRRLREDTLLIWVKASPEEHMARVLSQGDRRPIADRPDAMAELRRLLDSRTPYYRQARYVADTSDASPQACVERLVAGLGGA